MPTCADEPKTVSVAELKNIIVRVAANLEYSTDVAELHIILESDGDQLFFGFGSPRLPKVMFVDSLTRTLVHLGEDVVSELEQTIENELTDMRESLSDSLSELKDMVLSTEQADFDTECLSDGCESFFDELKDQIERARRKINSSRTFSKISEYQEDLEELRNALEDFAEDGIVSLVPNA